MHVIVAPVFANRGNFFSALVYIEDGCGRRGGRSDGGDGGKEWGWVIMRSQDIRGRSGAGGATERRRGEGGGTE